jgi:ribosomal protein S18 acetylase RimI-like enzyme
MLDSLDGLYPLTKKDVDKAAQVLSKAFFHDPGICFSFPDERTRVKKSAVMWGMTLRDRIRYGEAYASSSEIEGVALWLPSVRGEMGLRRALQAIPFRKIGALLSATRRGLLLSDTLEKAHRETIQDPHLYLSTLGVDPAHQGKGLASRLVKPMLKRCIQEKTPIYLETATEKDVQLYLHYGFEVQSEFRVGQSELIMKGMLFTPPL